MDAQPGSSRAFPAGGVSSSTTNLISAHRHISSRPTAQHRGHTYLINRRPATMKELPRLYPMPATSTAGPPLQPGGASQHSWSQSATPTSNFGSNTGVSGSSTAHIPPILIPDLTGLITRCGQDPISGGTYGNIYKCIYHGPEGNVDVAVKAIRPQFFSVEVFRRELGLWKRLQHSNILNFMGTTGDFGSSVALVAPWMVNGTLTSFLKEKSKTLALRDRLLLLRDIASGLIYLHTFIFTVDGQTYVNPVVHGDLTGTNVLIGSDGTAYLADFGLSGTLTESPGMTYLAKMSCHPGAMRWSAPELLSGEDSTSAITTQSDIYSFGSIMLQVLTGSVPWQHLTNETAILLKVVEGQIHPRPDNPCVTDRSWNFMTRCWSKSPIDRPSAEEALQFVTSELACGGQHPALVPMPINVLPLDPEDWGYSSVRASYHGAGGDGDAAPRAARVAAASTMTTSPDAPPPAPPAPARNPYLPSGSGSDSGNRYPAPPQAPAQTQSYLNSVRPYPPSSNGRYSYQAPYPDAWPYQGSIKNRAEKYAYTYPPSAWGASLSQGEWAQIFDTMREPPRER